MTNHPNRNRFPYLVQAGTSKPAGFPDRGAAHDYAVWLSTNLTVTVIVVGPGEATDYVAGFIVKHTHGVTHHAYPI